MASELGARLRSAIALDAPYDGVPRFSGEGIPAAVLIVLGFHADNSDPHLLVTRRTHRVETHKGQMAFPGGHRDPDDSSAMATALREAQEEVGLDPGIVQVVGEMPALKTVTGFVVTPVVSTLGPPIGNLNLVPAEEEIDAMLWVGLSRLREVYRRESIEHGSLRYPIDVFQVDEYRIWGVTGTLVKNLLDRIERVG